MIYKSELDKLPDAFQVRALLKKIQDAAPVRHLLPTEHVIDGEDTYILTRLTNGQYVVKPNITKQGVLYYGNVNGHEFKDKFISRYYEVKKNISMHDSLMYNNVRLEQFKLLVETFPLYVLLKNGIDIPGVGVTFKMQNAYGLASAYGLPSPYVNLTSSMDVALFYATHKYNKESSLFEFADEGNEGIVYIFNVFQPLEQIASLSILGKELFPGTLNSKNFLSVLAPTEDFNNRENVFGLTFKQTREASEYFSGLFNKGELLKPKNDILQKKLQSIDRIIYENAIEVNLEKNPSDDREKNLKVLENTFYLSLLPGTPSFTKSDLLQVDLVDMWYQFLDKITPLNEMDVKILEELKLLPTSEKYSCYFNVNKYYEKR